MSKKGIDVYINLKAIETLLDSYVQSAVRRGIECRQVQKALGLSRNILQRHFRIKYQRRLVEPMHSLLRYSDCKVDPRTGLIIRPEHKKNWRRVRRERSKLRGRKLSELSMG